MSIPISKNDSLDVRAKKILSKLRRVYPEAKTALTHSDPLQLLIATILSAQCTDERVNIVTKDLFKKYKSVQDYADAKQQVLEQDIYSTGFYRAKAKNIIRCCTMLVDKFNSKVPSTMEELLELPGVGRKTANVVLGYAFNKIEGIVVDTHVARLSNRLGFSTQSNPEKIEQDLMSVIPKKDWILISNVLVLHGRQTCSARKPRCADCAVNDLCPSADMFMKSAR